MHAYPYAIDAIVKRVEGDAYWSDETDIKYELHDERLEVYDVFHLKQL